MEDHGYGSLFDAPKTPRKWQKPAVKKEYVNSPHTNTDWLGSTGMETTSTPTRRSMKVDNWMGGGVGESPSSSSRPGPIKIDGYRSSIKDNPFLKK